MAIAFVDKLVDSLQTFLTGGASNMNPNLSLGGVVSSWRMRGLGAIAQVPVQIPTIRIDNIMPACGVGAASILVTTGGDLVFTPPNSAPGRPITPTSGGSTLLAGADANKVIRVYLEPGLLLPLGATGNYTFVEILNSVLAHKDVTNAQRLAGVTTYRALMLFAAAANGVQGIKLWVPPIPGLQSTYALAAEAPSGNAIQTIANETTAPTGVSWVAAVDEASALSIPQMASTSYKGIWIRRTFPIGKMAPLEKVQLVLKYQGA